MSGSPLRSWMLGSCAFPSAGSTDSFRLQVNDVEKINGNKDTTNTGSSCSTQSDINETTLIDEITDNLTQADPVLDGSSGVFRTSNVLYNASACESDSIKAGAAAQDDAAALEELIQRTSSPRLRRRFRHLIKWARGRWPAANYQVPGQQLRSPVYWQQHSGNKNYSTALQALLRNEWLPSPLKLEWGEEEKVAWLRSQLIGDRSVSIDTPFGKRPLVYADHTASGRSIRFIEDFILQNVLPCYGNTHTEDSYVGRMTTTMMHQAEAYVKQKLLGTAKEDDYALMFSGNGCTAALKRLQEVMGLAIPSTLRTRILESGLIPDEDRWLVLVGPYEHHSNLLSWRQSLAELVEIPVDSRGRIDMDVLEQSLQANQGRRLKLGSFSACSNVTGLLTDTRAIARLFHRHGGFVCFDFAARAPHERIQMHMEEDSNCSGVDSSYDAVVLSPHKLPGGPGSPGVLLMKRHLYLLSDHPPSTCGGGTVDYVNGFNDQDTLYSKSIEQREDAGTPAIVGKIRCALAFWVSDFMGDAMIKRREAIYTTKAIKIFSKNPNIQVIGQDPTTFIRRAPIVSFVIRNKLENIVLQRLSKKVVTEDVKSNETTHMVSSRQFLKPLHSRFVACLLNDLFGIQARGGCACAGPYGHILLGVNKEKSLAIRDSITQGFEGLKLGWTRVSLCYNMVEEEVHYVLSAIEFIAHYGHRFLGLYDFDWYTGNWSMSKAFKFDIKDVTYKNLNSQLQRSLINLEQLIQGKIDIEETHSTSHVEIPKFQQVLLVAKGISHHLSKFPPHNRSIPKNIDPKLLLFLF